MRPRDKIKTIQDYDKFLRSRGFSKRETRILCMAWYRLEDDAKPCKSSQNSGIKEFVPCDDLSRGIH